MLMSELPKKLPLTWYIRKKTDKNKTGKPAKAQNIRYIASIEKPKRKVMEEIHEQVKDENFGILHIGIKVVYTF